ncbi:MAG: histidine--tRNA ligase [Anaerolineales bacterium]
MAKKAVIQSVKGTRDFYPELMAVRKWLYETAGSVAEIYGYQEYEGPLIESLELYAAKSGDELVKNQSFVFKDRGGNLITLRPELTPTLARMVAQRQNQLLFPIRWWSFGPFWRYERPQKGRTREFFQWNIDLIGSKSAAADAELIAIVATFFQKVGLAPQDAQILVNNRQLMEAELASIGIAAADYKKIFRLIDRRDKLPQEKWEAYAVDLGLQTRQIEQLHGLLEDQNLWQKSADLKDLFPAIDALGVSDYVQFAPNVIRGLDYYTGTVFEAQAIKGDLRRSILGGGRYDNLLSDVGGDKIPAVGFAMGDLVISLVLEELNLIPAAITSPPANILVTLFNDASYKESLALANQLREAGIKVNSYPQADKLSKQLQYADRSGIKIAVLLGPDEIIKDVITIKNLATGDQQTVDRSKCAQYIAEMLEDIDSS